MLRKQFGILDSCLWLRMRRQCLRPVNHPLREYWRILRRLATCNGTVIEPPGSFFSDVIIGQAVGLIAQVFFDGDESVSTFGNILQQFADMVGFEPIAAQEQNLL